MAKNHNQYLWLGYIFFWCLVYLINTGPHWGIYSTTRELIETVGLVTSLQMLIAFIAIKYLIPISLSKNKNIKFIVLLIVLTFIACQIHILIRVLYLEPTYPESYVRFFEINGKRTLIERMFSLWTMKYLFFWKFPQHLYPAFILIAHSFYLTQRQLLKISEQKQKAELKALKNQLNPHFIFNTLNNLYSLTLQKSERAPIVIEKLSDILDYVLYRCNEKYVYLESEVALLKSYITLEEIRYGKRIQVTLETNIESNPKIAPLLLLNLVENACKHSTSEEIGLAKVSIVINANDSQIFCSINNTIPSLIKPSQSGGIGLQNLQRQLDLIYPNQHELLIEQDSASFQVTLKVEVK